MILFDRQSILTIGAKQYKSDDIDFDFYVPFSTENEPDLTEISIYNLSPDSIASIKKGTPVNLSAGYGKEIGIIASGEVIEYTTTIEDVDKKTTLKIGSAINSWREKKIHKTYAKGTTTKDVMLDLINNFGVTIGDITIVKNVIYKRGKTVSGRLKDVVKKLAKESESKFYIDKDRAYVRPHSKGTSTGFLLSGATGLIGSPERIEINEDNQKSKQGWKVQCLLNHNIFTDSMITIDSKMVKGSFRVVKGKHTSEWITEMEVV